MKKLMLVALGLVALTAIGCSNSGGSSSPATSGYTYSTNGTCVQQSTGQTVPSTYCQGNGAVGSQQCYGQYYFYNGSTWMSGMCNGQNCSGFTLYNTAGQQVRCL